MSKKRVSKPLGLTRPNLTEIDSVWYDLSREGQPAWPGGPKTTPPHKDWTENEKWAWRQIHKNGNADFNSLYKHDPQLPTDQEWSDDTKNDRAIRPRFLEMILSSEPWKTALPYSGFSLCGAYFLETLDLRRISITSRLTLRYNIFEMGVILKEADSDHTIDMDFSNIKGIANFENLRTKKSLFLRNTVFNGLDLKNAKIGGLLSLENARSNASILMLGIDVGGLLNMDEIESKFKLDMSGGHFRGQVLMRNATFFNVVEMKSIRADGNVYLDGSQMKWNFYINDSIVDGDCYLNDATVSTGLEAEDLTINGDLWLKGCCLLKMPENYALEYPGESEDDEEEPYEGLFFGWSNIQGSAILCDSQLNSLVSFENASIRKTLKLDMEEPQWGESGSLVLRGANIGTICDTISAWPHVEGSVDFEGLTYGYFGGGEEGEENQLTKRRGEWFVKLLSLQRNDSPQPYRQCYRMLRAVGHTRKANVVKRALYEQRRKSWKQEKVDKEIRKDRAKAISWRNPFRKALTRFEIKGYLRYAWRTALKWTINYGVGAGYLRSLLCGGLLATIGWLVILLVHYGVMEGIELPKLNKHSLAWWAAFSLDQTIPVLELAKGHTDIIKDIHGIPRAWFMFQKFGSWFLALVVVAGLTGLVGRKEE